MGGSRPILLLVSLALAGCLEDPRCDPGDRLVEDFICRPPDAGPGAACGPDGGCPGAALRCVRPEGVDGGVCTTTGCDGDGGACPAGFTCAEAAGTTACLPGEGG
jgi:hypothetical protein